MTRMDGNLLLHLATIFSFLLVIGLFYKNHFKYKISIYLIEALMVLGITLTITALMSLVFSYINSDLSIINVALNSHPAMPLHYRIAALWGNHDGSLLLLTSFLAIYIFITYFFCKNHPIYWELLLVQAVIFSALLLFLTIKANPFLRSFPVPKSGLGLNPILQDKAIMIHPPILYLSHAASIVIYSIALVSLKLKIPFHSLVKLLKPWLYLALSLSTLGIGLGSWWAYREIGWGGFWFWDPVETLSLLPWLLLITAVHSCNNSTSHRILVFSAITSFISIIFSIFLLRSGLVNSIHSFALDLDKAYPLFIYFICSCFFPLFFAGNNQLSKKISSIKSSKKPKLQLIFWAKCLFIILFSLLLVTLLIPIISNVFLLKIVLTEQLFQKITAVISLLIIILLSLCYRVKMTFLRIVTILIASSICTYLASKNLQFLTIINSIILTYLTLSLLLLIKKQLSTKMKARDYLHCVFCLFIVSTTSNYLFSNEGTFEIDYGTKINFLSEEIIVTNFRVSQDDNKLTKTVVLTMPNGEVASPSLQIFPLERQIVPDPFIINNLFYDLFFSVQQLKQDKFILNIQYKPMMNGLWLSILLFFIITGQQAIKQFILYKSSIRNYYSKNTTALSRVIVNIN